MCGSVDLHGIGIGIPSLFGLVVLARGCVCGIVLCVVDCMVALATFVRGRGLWPSGDVGEECAVVLGSGRDDGTGDVAGVAAAASRSGRGGHGGQRRGQQRRRGRGVGGGGARARARARTRKGGRCNIIIYNTRRTIARARARSISRPLTLYVHHSAHPPYAPPPPNQHCAHLRPSFSLISVHVAVLAVRSQRYMYPSADSISTHPDRPRRALFAILHALFSSPAHVHPPLPVPRPILSIARSLVLLARLPGVFSPAPVACAHHARRS
ncbi:hypothetical protein C8Q77DRAFT_375178 [Trametes polyzona]|nr:hypothetical protein C8Q77DRAFT_375178 [Trametes polyzona]